MTESCTPATPEPRATNPAELNNLRAAHADELSSRTRATSIPADSCSLYDDEALGGTAGRATAWLALEHVGQWGRDVLDGSALGEELSEALGEAVSQAGLKFLLIRQAGRAGRVLHGAPDASGNPTHRVLYALCTPGEEKLYSFSVSTPEQLLDLPLSNPQELIQATGAELMDSPAILVCTHSKRDRCCALRGRPIAAHLSLAGRSIPSLHGLRGRSTDTPVEQAAEVAVRLELEKKGEEVTSGGLVSRETSGREAFVALREAGIDVNVETSTEFSPEFFAAFSPKDFSEHPTMEAALTSHTDGRTWVTFFERVTLEPRPNSCGKGPADAFSRELLALRQL